MTQKANVKYDERESMRMDNEGRTANSTKRCEDGSSECVQRTGGEGTRASRAMRGQSAILG